jgi:hypothetical protein
MWAEALMPVWFGFYQIQMFYGIKGMSEAETQGQLPVANCFFAACGREAHFAPTT